MAINFEKKIPDWENVGAEPDAELKKGGFRAGYKPPAAYFNWFFNRISESVKEMQEKLVVNLKALAFKDKVGNGDITDIAAGKITQDSTHRMITDTERTNWNDVTNKVDSTGGDISNTKVSEFTASTGSYPVPAAGDTAKGAFGKIAKFFGDIRNTATGACFIGQIVNNCVTNRADLPLSAAQGKVLMDLYTVLNNNFNENLTWKNAGSVDGSEAITLPLEYRELAVRCYFQSRNYRYGTTFHFSRNELMEIEIFFGQGYDAVGESHMFRLGVSASSIRMINANTGGSDVMASTNMMVFYR